MIYNKKILKSGYILIGYILKTLSVYPPISSTKVVLQLELDPIALPAQQPPS